MNGLKSLKYSVLMMSSKYTSLQNLQVLGRHMFPVAFTGNSSTPYQYNYPFAAPLNITGNVGSFVSIIGIRIGNSILTNQYILDFKVEVLNITTNSIQLLMYSVRDIGKTYVGFFACHLVVYNKDYYRNNFDI